MKEVDGQTDTESVSSLDKRRKDPDAAEKRAERDRARDAGKRDIGNFDPELADAIQNLVDGSSPPRPQRTGPPLTIGGLESNSTVLLFPVTPTGKLPNTASIHAERPAETDKLTLEGLRDRHPSTMELPPRTNLNVVK